MNKELRINLVKAMELIARTVNDESVFEGWLMRGVADGDINENTTDEELECYIDDTTFSELMGTFLRLMSRAKRCGGLYADGLLAMTDYLERYIDTMEPGAEQEIGKYLANGWFVYYEGVTLVILRRKYGI